MPGQYIVVLAGAADPEAVANESKMLHRGRLKHIFKHAVRGFAMQLTRERAEALARDPRVAFVEEDGRVRASGMDASAPWGLDRIDQRTLPLDGTYSYPDPIRQVRIHVLDTGVRVSHVSFGGRAFNAGDFVDDDLDWDETDIANDDKTPGVPDGQDCNGHGTHVAAIAAGIDYGVARNATVMSYRVLDCNGDGLVSSVIAGVDAVTADSYRPAVANMSLSGDVSDALDEAVRRSIASGITYVVASGNKGASASTQSPARVAEAITVSATAVDDRRADFANYGSLVDLFAPGVNVDSAWYTDDFAHAISSGTSMAAPHATGVVALYLEQTPTAAPAAVRDALVAIATPGVVTNAGTGSPNRLLYSRIAAPPVPVPAPTLPAPWATTDIGPVIAAGGASYSSGTFTVDGSGADIWGSSDAFRFVYRTLSGDGSIVARVTGVQNVAKWTKAAVMIRSGMSTSAANAALVVTPAAGLSFQSRSSAGATTVAAVAPGAAPVWVKLTRTGTTIKAYRSTDGTSWITIATATVALGADAQVGLAVTSQSAGQVARATFTNVSVTAAASSVTPSAPVAYSTVDIGAVGVAGYARANADGSYAIGGGGADVWGTADALRFMYKAISGDFDIETRIATLDPVHTWTKAGVMIRGSLSANAQQAFALVSPGAGLALQYRGTTGGSSAGAGSASGRAPYWLKLSRRGSTITAYRKIDGGSWQLLGTKSIAFPTTVYVGVGVSSHNATRLASATVSSLKIVTY